MVRFSAGGGVLGGVGGCLGAVYAVFARDIRSVRDIVRLCLVETKHCGTHILPVWLVLMDCRWSSGGRGVVFLREGKGASSSKLAAGPTVLGDMSSHVHQVSQHINPTSDFDLIQPRLAKRLRNYFRNQLQDVVNCIPYATPARHLPRTMWAIKPSLDGIDLTSALQYLPEMLDTRD